MCQDTYLCIYYVYDPVFLSYIYIIFLNSFWTLNFFYIFDNFNFKKCISSVVSSQTWMRLWYLLSVFIFYDISFILFYKNSINYTYIHNISFKNFELFFWTLRFFLQRVYICMYVCMYVCMKIVKFVYFLSDIVKKFACGGLPSGGRLKRRSASGGPLRGG